MRFHNDVDSGGNAKVGKAIFNKGQGILSAPCRGRITWYCAGLEYAFR